MAHNSDSFVSRRLEYSCSFNILIRIPLLNKNNRACTSSPWFEDPKGFDILFGLDICLFKRAAESNEVWNGIKIDRKLNTS